MSEEASTTSTLTLASTSESNVMSPSKLRPSLMSSIDSLKVPTPLLTNDNTPTPVRMLLRDFETNGISFQDLASTNPFDAHFRRAMEESKKADSTEETLTAEDASAKTANDEESLSTPQIISLLEAKLQSPTIMTPSLQVPCKDDQGQHGLRKILPKSDPNDSQAKFDAERAQLVLKLSGGQAIHLADMPVVQHPVMPKSEVKGSNMKGIASQEREPARRRKKPISTNEEETQPKTSTSSSEIDFKRREVLERNRLAAKRSRDKKKKQNERALETIKALENANLILSQENATLKEENAALKQIVRGHLTFPTGFNLGTRGMSQKVSERLKSVQILPSTSETVSVAPVVQLLKPPIKRAKNLEEAVTQDVSQEVKNQKTGKISQKSSKSSSKRK